MKTSLSHLPESKRQQIQEIVKITRSVVEPEKIILFGSYATGSWVEDTFKKDHITYEYISDYDLLVILKSGEKLQDHVIQDMIENRCHFREPVNVIVHDIDYVNGALSESRYFFIDIYKEGVLLYDAGNIEIVQPQIPDIQKARRIAQQDFDKWFKSGKKFLRIAEQAFRDSLSRNEKLNEIIFILHQATERFYNAVILVFTGYKYKTHNLHKLRRHTKRFSKDLFSLFPYPSDNDEADHLFNLLKKGYIEARYDDSYEITEKELSVLLIKINEMKNIVEVLCKNKIAGMN